MTKIQYLLKGINGLNPNDLELVFKEILRKMNQKKRLQEILNEYKGIGKGIWGIDAQNYINKDREQDRA